MENKIQTLFLMNLVHTLDAREKYFKNQIKITKFKGWWCGVRFVWYLTFLSCILHTADICWGVFGVKDWWDVIDNDIDTAADLLTDQPNADCDIVCEYFTQHCMQRYTQISHLTLIPLTDHTGRNGKSPPRN